MRDKRRYVLVKITPSWVCPDTKSIYLVVQEAITSLWGDVIAAGIQMAVVYGDKEFCIIRCRRGCEGQLATALSTVSSMNEQGISLRSYAVSGTMLALKRRIEKCRKGPVPDARELVIGERIFEAYYFPGQKVDLLEKGFKSRELLFLTETDIEEM
jgi:ribonuclease P/MRP protein subunit POP5